MDLNEMRDRLRSDLHDEDLTNQRWTDAELEEGASGGGGVGADEYGD